MPNPQDTGAPPAVASNPDTGIPPGGSGGGTADPHQIVPSGQTGQLDDIQEYEDPYNPLEHQLEESEWDFEDDNQEINLGDDNPNEDEDSDPHGQGLPEQPPGWTNGAQIVHSLVQQSAVRVRSSFHINRTPLSRYPL